MDFSPISSVAASGGLFGDSALHAGQTPAQQRAAVAGQFEAVMLRQLLSDSVGAMLGGDDSASGSIYGYLATDVFASKLASAGGLGLAKMIAGQLGPRPAPETAASEQEENP